MYEVHPGPFPGHSHESMQDEGGTAWILYQDKFDVIAWFTCKEDAEFAKVFFQKREASSEKPPSKNDESDEPIIIG